MQLHHAFIARSRAHGGSLVTTDAPSVVARTSCGVAELNAAELTPAELEAAFGLLRDASLPVIIRSAAHQSTLLHSEELTSLLSGADVSGADCVTVCASCASHRMCNVRVKEFA
jgi:hypothetical protein